MKKKRIPGISPRPPHKEKKTSSIDKITQTGCLLFFAFILFSIAAPNCKQFNIRVRATHLTFYRTYIVRALDKYHEKHHKYPTMMPNGLIPAVLYRSNTSLKEARLKYDEDDTCRYYYLPEQDDYILFSAGPDKDLDLPPLLFQIMRDNIELNGDKLLISSYNPTNGTVSNGDYYHSNNEDILGQFAGDPGQ